MLPYPYHSDQHQKLNAEKLVAAGGGLIVEDHPQNPIRTATDLGQQLKLLMGDTGRLKQMAEATRGLRRPTASEEVAKHILEMALLDRPAQGAAGKLP
jgi:UDP-N-acetylglucosamine:LPS N-acetylglucosamine transferase